jgi:hypothetical protein
LFVKVLYKYPVPVIVGATVLPGTLAAANTFVHLKPQSMRHFFYEILI